MGYAVECILTLFAPRSGPGIANPVAPQSWPSVPGVMPMTRDGFTGRGEGARHRSHRLGSPIDRASVGKSVRVRAEV